jgi:hypothetical protein
MKFLTRIAPFTYFLPLFAFAQDFTYFNDFVAQVVAFINVAIPFVFALAFLVFIWGMFKAFILGGSNPEKQEEGKQLMLYAIVGFVIMVSVWGIVNLFTEIFGFDEQEQTIEIPDLPTSI